MKWWAKLPQLTLIFIPNHLTESAIEKVRRLIEQLFQMNYCYLSCRVAASHVHTRRLLKIWREHFIII